MARTSAGGIQPAEVQNSVYTYAEDAQASDSYAITLSPAPSAYTTGQMFLFKANTANTGASSLNVNGLGPITIKKHKGEDLANNDIKEDSVVSVVYDGTNFQMISMLSNAPAGSGDMTKVVYDTDDDGKVNEAEAVEGTGVKSTGEAGGTKFLREDGDGTCSWQTPTAVESDPVVGAITGIVKANGAGTISAASQGTDYYAPSGTDVAVADGGTGASTAVNAAHNLIDGISLTAATVAATDKLLLQDADGSDVLKTATASSVAALATPEGTAVKSTGEAGGTKFLREDGDGTSSWQTPSYSTRDSLGLDTDDSPQFAGINIGHASDTTLARVSAGVVSIEGSNILTAATGLPLAGGTMTGNITLGENTSVDLDPSLSADGKYTGKCITGTAGATLAFGDIIYLAAADSRWELTDASAVGTAGTVLVGICVLAATGDGEPTKILLDGNVRADTAFPTFTVGAPIYISETAGDVTQTAPTTADAVVRVLGFALTADSMRFVPSSDHITVTG